jgi:hypothetical protein
MEYSTFYKMFKLTSGDNIICGTEDDCKNFPERGTILVTNPVVLNVVRMPKEDRLVESYILIPWFSFSNEDSYEISTEQIITIVEINDSLKYNYLDYLEARQKEKEDDEDFESEESMEEIDRECEDTFQGLMETLSEHLGEQIDEEDTEPGNDFFNRGSRRGTKTLH